MGLVHVLENLSDPGTLGPAISSAFIATFYGVVVREPRVPADRQQAEADLARRGARPHDAHRGRHLDPGGRQPARRRGEAPDVPRPGRARGTSARGEPGRAAEADESVGHGAAA